MVLVMKKLIILGVILFLCACSVENQDLNDDFCGTETLSSCEDDRDCVTDGCSGEVCRAVNDESYITTCEWKDCYEKNGLECECVGNKCSWN